VSSNTWHAHILEHYLVQEKYKKSLTWRAFTIVTVSFLILN